MVEQAVNAIYALAKHPDDLCAGILRRKTKAVFVKQEPKDEPMNDGDISMEIESTPKPKPPPPNSASHGFDVLELSQLLFLAGHIASESCFIVPLCLRCSKETVYSQTNRSFGAM